MVFIDSSRSRCEEEREKEKKKQADSQLIDRACIVKCKLSRGRAIDESFFDNRSIVDKLQKGNQSCRRSDSACAYLGIKFIKWEGTDESLLRALLGCY